MLKQREDALWGELIEYLESCQVPCKRLPEATLDQFVLADELLCYVQGKTDGSLHYSLIVPQVLQTKDLQHAHELPGHLIQKKTIKKAEEMFYWTNLKADVRGYVKKCITCQRFKGETGLQQQWKELPPVDKPLERIGID